MSNKMRGVKTAMDMLSDRVTRDDVAMRAGFRPRKSNLACVCVLVVMSALAWGRTAEATQVYSDRVAATVNGDVILESEVKEQKHPFVRKNFSMPLGVVPPGKIPTEKEILDELVVMRLLEQEAAKKGIQMTDQGLDAAIKSLRERNELSRDKFIMFLAANGLNYADYRKMMKRQMVLSALLNRELGQKAAITEKDAQQYFKEHKGDIDEQYEKLINRLTAPADPQEETKPEVPTHKEVYRGGQLRIRQIILKIDNPANKNEKDKLLQTVRAIYDQLKTGADFSQLAKKYSQDATASKGGEIGTLDFKDMNPNLQKMVEQMKVGEVAPPLSTKNSLIILNLAEGKNRKIQKVAIPAAERKRMQQEIDQMFARRKAERERAREDALKAARSPRKNESESAANEEKDSDNKGVNKKEEKDPGILTADEKKEYQKVRDRVMNILRSQKMQDTMKQWVQDLKKNSIIEVRL
jgi:parvulin-like peptidyl-prolyl isomerase